MKRPNPRAALAGLRALLCLVGVLAAFASAADRSDAIAAAVAHADRPAEDRARDATSHPAEILAFAGIGPGDVVLDLFAGGGYYSELAARVVGPEGRVWMHNNDAYVGFVGEALTTRLADDRLPNVVRSDQELADLTFPENSVDVALMVMSWHDLYWVSEDWPVFDVEDVLARLAHVLVPGGTLVIVDHAAVDGSGTDAVDGLHRIDEAHVVETLEAQGFVLEGHSNVLRNAADDRTLGVFDESIRRRTDRFVLRFAAPG